jgi:RNA polymerase sigma-70 factor (ECF subfamily)
MSASEESAPDLLPLIAAGDGEAVHACLRRYGPLVWSLAKRLGADVAAVEDLVQDIFIEIWRKADRYDASRASETTFIATIARRRVIDRRRRDARGAEQDLENVPEAVLASADPGFARVEHGDEARRARAALEMLQPDQRRVILLAVVEGLTHRSIARATGIPLGTVKSHIRRGLERAARLLRGPEGSAP